MTTTNRYHVSKEPGYSEREHDRLLAQHARRYEEMRQVARLQGRSGDDYKRARDAVLDAARLVRRTARKRHPRRGF